eukprot:TRINITY_DN23666_c0_g1_i3.p1 TRINITY_DN23666_c0_g1~~TRINITY_DN23666_c0_g1_i3.p1  ORF type:complete len:274 (+),score=126.67 TRINITY_DN23666_c0_g1_i3:105-926(+)
MADTLHPVLEVLRQDLASRGIDAWKPFAAEWYNEEREKLDDKVKESLHVLPEAPWSRKDGKGTAAVLIGNSKALWPKFIDHLHARGVKTEEDLGENPFDKFVRDNITEAVKTCLGEKGITYRCFWSPRDADGKVISLQRVAVLAGDAYLDNGTHLCIHPVFGAWCSYRGVISIEVEYPLAPLPTPLPPLVSQEEEAAATAAFQVALKSSDSETTMKCHCGKGGMGPNWHTWVDLRDVVRLNKDQARFSDAQVEYHYTREPDVLLKEVALRAGQ